MSINRSDVERRFDRSAGSGSYDALASVQRFMVEKLVESIAGWTNENSAKPIRILEIGCGTGALTERLVQMRAGAHLTAIDLSSEMIQAAKRRLTANASCDARFLHADVEQWAALAEPGSYDLVVSSACFQWLRHPGQTMASLRRLLRPNGLLAFTTFGTRTFYELHESFDDAYLSSGKEPQRHGLSFQSLADWRRLLQEAGFVGIREERVIRTEKYRSVSDFLHSVKALGASASEAASSRGLGSRSLFAGMYRAYNEKFGMDGGVAATYDLLLLHADPPE